MQNGESGLLLGEQKETERKVNNITSSGTDKGTPHAVVAGAMTLSYGGTGAAAGSLLGPIGTAVGAGFGLVAGVGTSIYLKHAQSSSIEDRAEVLEEISDPDVQRKISRSKSITKDLKEFYRASGELATKLESEDRGDKWNKTKEELQKEIKVSPPSEGLKRAALKLVPACIENEVECDINIMLGKKAKNSTAILNERRETRTQDQGRMGYGTLA